MLTEQPPRRPRILSSAERRERVIPLGFQLSGMALNLVSMVHNEWAADVLARFWFTVFKSAPKPWVAEFWRGAHRRLDVAVEDVVIPVHCWGQGPPVVMMHGWSGSGTQFRYFIQPLVAAGFTAVCFDAPEHGSNPGKRSDMPRFSATLLAIQQQLGDMHTVIAHSLGAMAATYALQLGLKPAHLVLVAPHLEVQKMFETFCQLLNLRPALAARFYDKIGTKMRSLMDGADPWQALNPTKLLAEIKLRGLLVYDHEDPEVSAPQFAEMAALWQGCEIVATQGLGHNRGLKDDGVIAAVVDFIRQV